MGDPGLWLPLMGAIGMYCLSGPPHPPPLHSRYLILIPSTPILSLCPPPHQGFPPQGLEVCMMPIAL